MKEMAVKMQAGDRLRLLRAQNGLNQKDFADSLGVTQQSLSRYESGRLGIPEEVMVKLHSKRISLNWLLTGEGPMMIPASAIGKYDTSVVFGDVRIVHPDELTGSDFLVPLLDQAVSAGPGGDLSESDQVRALIPAPPYLSRFGKSIAALPVRGDSMEPTLRNGDLVVCDTMGWQDEGIYVVQFNSQSFVKRVTIRLKSYIILSDNRAYPPVEEPLESEGLRIVGKVRCAVRAME